MASQNTGTAAPTDCGPWRDGAGCVSASKGTGDNAIINPGADTKARARRLYARAVRWTIDNPEAWRYIRGLLDGELAANRRCSMQWAVEQMRKRSHTSNDGAPTRISNTACAALARIYVTANPEAAQRMALRPSMFDLV